MGNTNPNEVFGHRITKITENSPASGASFEIYADFIIDILDKPKQFNLETDFQKIIADHENKTIHFKVYNILTRETRIVPFVPTREWPNSDSLLGFNTRYESVTDAAENVYRITGIKNPDLFDQIKIQDEFFLAIVEFPFKDLADLKRQLILHSQIHLVLFSLLTHRVRIMRIDIGPQQGLGFEISTGVLHDLSYILKNSQKSLEKEVSKDIRFGNIEKTSLFHEAAPEIEMVPLAKQTSAPNPEPVKNQSQSIDKNSDSKQTFNENEKPSINQNDWNLPGTGEGDLEDEDLATVNL